MVALVQAFALNQKKDGQKAKANSNAGTPFEQLRAQFGYGYFLRINPIES
jgi:hypothetical protein